MTRFSVPAFLLLFLPALAVCSSPAAAGGGEDKGFPGFEDPVFYDVGNAPNSVAVGDIDGDGHLDLVVAGNNNQQVSVLLGRGDGTFEPNTPFFLGHRPTDVVLVDLDDDGDLDMAIASAVSGGVLILHNDGLGNFELVQGIGTGVQTQDIAAGDLNGNGLIDLAASNLGSNTVSVLFNQGDGFFSSPTTYPAGTWPTDVAVGDLTGNGHLDIAVANALSADVTLRFNDGQGGFDNSVTFDGSARSIVIMDGNLNGANDLFVAGALGIRIRENLGGGLLAPYGSLPENNAGNGGWDSLIAADFNLDGVPDLAATVFGGNAVTPFRIVALIGVREMLFILQEDVVTDGQINGHDLGFVLMNWGPAGDLGSGLDFNRDGVVNGADLALMLAKWGEAPLFQRWQHVFDEALSPVTATGLAVGDFNGDGAPDIVSVGDGHASVFLNRVRGPTAERKND